MHLMRLLRYCTQEHAHTSTQHPKRAHPAPGSPALTPAERGTVTHAWGSAFFSLCRLPVLCSASSTASAAAHGIRANIRTSIRATLTRRTDKSTATPASYPLPTLSPTHTIAAPAIVFATLMCNTDSRCSLLGYSGCELCEVRWWRGGH